jgi:TonB-linked SusC/RagA family outer membrane protein
MIMNRILLSLVLILSTAGLLRAQEKEVTGVVSSSSDKLPIPGVNVRVKDTSIGTISDIEGRFTLKVPPDGTALIFSYIGMQTMEVPVGSQSSFEIAMDPDTKELQEVVVTAIGIEREKKALGYAVSDVDAEQVTKKAEPDPVRALTGKVPGVNIQGGGGAVGGNTFINIRGNSSLTQNNQPLFVVDGVPFDNSTFETGDGKSVSEGTAGNQFTNRAFDIDPNNIESITVLKGASAAALYGSRAANGAIIITTKSGSAGSKKGFEVTFNTSYSAEQVAALPDYQSTYGSGQHQNLVVAFNGSIGPAFSEYDSVQHILDGSHLRNTSVGQLYAGKRMAYRAYPNSVSDFLETGHLLENSIQINSGGDKASLAAGFSHMNNSGIIPNSSISRTSLNAGGRATLDNGLFLSGNINYVNTSQQTPQVAASLGGENSSVIERLLFIPTMYDLTNLLFEDPITGENIYNRTGVDNPYWVAKYAPYTSDVNRAFGKVQVGYDLTDWMSISYQAGFNVYNDRRKNVVQRGSADVPLGRITQDNIFREELDGNLLLSMNKDITSRLNARLILGHNVNQRTTKRQINEGNGIIVFGNNNFSNTAAQRVISDVMFQQRYQGVFSDLSLSYNDVYFLNIVARNDWSSTLPKNNRSYFYPGVSGSVIFSDALNITSNFLNFGKLRVGYTRVGNEAEPYRTTTPYITNTNFNLTAFPFIQEGTTFNSLTLSDNSGSPDLRPEFITEFEVGTELRLLNNKVGIDFTYYNKITTNSIASIVLPPSSGFSTKLTNIGKLRNNGIEIGLDLTPLELDNGFTWNIFTSFTRNRNKVLDLGGADQIVIGGVPGSNLLVVHQVGKPFGQLVGLKMMRDDEGNLVIGNNQLGRPLTAGLGIIGDPNPDYILGVTSTMRFKGINFSFLVDYKHGGDMWSQTAEELLGRGVVDIGDREAGRVIPGVLANDEGTGPLIVDGEKVRNNIVITNYDWWFTNSFGITVFHDVHTYDASVVRLREVSLGYDLPKPLLSKTPFGSASITFSGRNLWFFAPNFPKQMNFDPETATAPGAAFQGLDFMGVPTTRRYGVNLTVTF